VIVTLFSFVLTLSGSLSPLPQQAHAVAVAPCPTTSTPTGGPRYLLVAANNEPGGGAADYVCATILFTGGSLNSAIISQDPCGIPPIAAPGAASNLVWADWNNNDCMTTGRTVWIIFQCAICTPTTVLKISSVVWHISTGPAAGTNWDGTASASLGNNGGPVGGQIVPVNKLAVLAPYVGLASVIGAITMLTTVVYLRRQKSKKTSNN
jgi:hypothetical protein